MKPSKLSKSAIALTLILWATSPVQAASKTTNQQSSFMDEISSLFSSVRQYVQQVSREFSNTFGKLSPEVQSAIEAAMGSLGIPDPIEAGEKIEDVISQQETKTLETAAGVLGVNARYDWDEKFAKAQSQSILGKQGQQQMAVNRQATVDAAQKSALEAQQSETDLTTQDLIRRQLRQNALETEALAAMQGSLQDTARLTATNGLSLQNIAERDNQKQRQEEIESRAELQSALQVAGFQNGLLADRTAGGN